MAHIKDNSMPRFSVLDLYPITEGSNAAQSFKNTLSLAQHAEGWGITANG